MLKYYKSHGTLSIWPGVLLHFSRKLVELEYGEQWLTPVTCGSGKCVNLIKSFLQDQMWEHELYTARRSIYSERLKDQAWYLYSVAYVGALPPAHMFAMQQFCLPSELRYLLGVRSATLSTTVRICMQRECPCLVRTKFDGVAKHTRNSHTSCMMLMECDIQTHDRVAVGAVAACTWCSDIYFVALEVAKRPHFTLLLGFWKTLRAPVRMMTWEDFMTKAELWRGATMDRKNRDAT